jgi:hypothetical protein
MRKAHLQWGIDNDNATPGGEGGSGSGSGGNAVVESQDGDGDNESYGDGGDELYDEDIMKAAVATTRHGRNIADAFMDSSVEQETAQLSWEPSSSTSPPSSSSSPSSSTSSSSATSSSTDTQNLEPYYTEPVAIRHRERPPPSHLRETKTVTRLSRSGESAPVPLSARVTPSLEGQGLQFYVSRYVMGHADEPKSPTGASGAWLWEPGLQDAMSAVGLAGLANLNNSDPRMTTLARQKYVTALHRTAKMIQKTSMSEMWVATRSVVLLAMFEVVNKGSPEQNCVNTHIMGAAALLRGFISLYNSAPSAFRGLIQLCYSTVCVANVA